MGFERRIALFRNGRSQAIRIPKEFEMPGNEAIITRDGEKLVLQPVERKPNLLEVLAAMTPSDEEFPEIPDPPPEPVDF
jgi:antitoxin VapB